MELRDHVRLAGTGEGSATTTLFGLDPERHLRSRPLDPEARTTVHRMMEESLFARATALVRQVEDRVDKEGGEEVASIATVGIRHKRNDTVLDLSWTLVVRDDITPVYKILLFKSH